MQLQIPIHSDTSVVAFYHPDPAVAGEESTTHQYPLRFLWRRSAIGMTSPGRLRRRHSWRVASQRRANCARAGNTAGAALITVLGVSLILMLAAITLFGLSSQSMHRIKRTVYMAQAQAVAEAGIADMVAKLATNYYLWQNATYEATFGSNGTYYVTTQLQTNGNVLITSDGIYLYASNRTIMELLGTLQSHYNDLYNLNSAVMSDGNVEFSSAAFTMNGDIHANGNATSAQGAQNGTITGNVSAVGNVGNLNPTGYKSNGVPEIVLPPEGPFNFDSYRQLALTNGTYYDNNADLTGTIPTPANGIMYVNGNLTITGNSTFTGTIVVSGNITINNQFTQTQSNSNMPSLLSNGNISLNNHVTLNGVVYAEGNVTIQNHIAINGGVISLGNTHIQNNVTINHATGYPVWDPLNPEVPPEVIAGGWLR